MKRVLIAAAAASVSLLLAGCATDGYYGGSYYGNPSRGYGYGYYNAPYGSGYGNYGYRSRDRDGGYYRRDGYRGDYDRRHLRR